MRRHRYLVCECGRGLAEVDFTQYDRKQQQNNAEQHRQPERAGRHHCRRRAGVRVVKRLRVENQHEDEVEDDAAPDDDVVEPGPVGRFQRTLRHRGPHTLLTTPASSVPIPLTLWGATSRTGKTRYNWGGQNFSIAGFSQLLQGLTR